MPFRPLLAVALAVLAVAPSAHAATCTRARVPAAPAAADLSPDETYAYLDRLDRASTRVRTGTYGRSTQGRPLRYALVSDARNLAPARLAAITARARAARAGTGPAPPASDPVIAWIAGGVHANEPSGIDADLQLAQRLAEGRSCSQLHDVLLVLTPLQNPDGRAAGTRVNAAGFDLNRDWFARTQPEADARIALLRQMPPVVFADQHEEDGSSFFFPPNSDPIFHEISRQALSNIDDVFGPALHAAFTKAGRPFLNRSIYDLFFEGYGDTVPSTLFGAAGMTFEKGGEAPAAQRVGDHLLAAETVVATAQGHKRALQLSWAAQWAQAREQGERGTLQPNRVIAPGDRVQRRVPSSPVRAYLLRGDVHAADAWRLVERLRSADVTVRVLRRTTTLPAYRAYGSRAAASATLPAGTFVVPMAQTQKHWVQALLGQDTYVPFPYFYDVSSWSNPLLMGLDGGWSERALPASATTALASKPSFGPSAAAAAYEVAGDSAGAGALLLDALRAGATVAREPDSGRAQLSGLSVGAMRHLAAAHSVPVVAAAAPLTAPVALRTPKVAVLADLLPVVKGRATIENSGAHEGQSWMRWLLGTRLGAGFTALDGAQLAAGALASGGYTAFVVPDGQTPTGALSTTALSQLAAWVRAGGTYVGVTGQGLALARAAGISAVTERQTTDALKLPGSTFAVTIDHSDPVAWGEDDRGFAFDDDAPVLEPPASGSGVTSVLTLGRLVSGYAEGESVLTGTPGVTDEATGAGRTVLFAVDPSFRGYTEGGQRLLVNALLAPPPAPSARAAGVRPVVPAALREAAQPSTPPSRIEVPAPALPVLRAHRPPGAHIERTRHGELLVVPNPNGTPGEDLPWVDPLLRALKAAGEKPRSIVL